MGNICSFSISDTINKEPKTQQIKEFQCRIFKNKIQTNRSKFSRRKPKFETDLIYQQNDESQDTIQIIEKQTSIITKQSIKSKTNKAEKKMISSFHNQKTFIFDDDDVDEALKYPKFYKTETIKQIQRLY